MRVKILVTKLFMKLQNYKEPKLEEQLIAARSFKWI